MLSFLFPPICPLCAKELLDKGEHICKICSKKQIFIKEPTCYSCGKSMKNQEKEYCSDCRRHPKNFERGMGLCIYQKPVTDSLAAIKYKNLSLCRCHPQAVFFSKQHSGQKEANLRIRQRFRPQALCNRRGFCRILCRKCGKPFYCPDL